MKNSIETHLDQRVLILDGAMGTMIQRHHLTEADYRGSRFATHHQNLHGCNDLLVLTQPDIIQAIHEEYLRVGVDLIETNSFNANAVSMADYDLVPLVRELNFEAARLARASADKFTAQDPKKPRFVAGSMGPTNRSLSLSPKVEDPAFRAIDFDTLMNAYAEQAQGLIEGGVDLLLVETIFDTLNAKAALAALEQAFELTGKRIPVMVSLTLEKSGRNLSGQTIAAFVASMTHLPLLSLGLNCSFGAKQIRPYLEELAALAPCYVSAYPNAGMPNQMGLYDETPETMAGHIEALLQKQLVNIIGGCCGTGPEHIAQYAALVARYQPRVRPNLQTQTILAGLEPLKIEKSSNFVNVGEQTNVAGSRKFARLIGEKNYEEALGIARKQIDQGAQILDICMDDAMLDAKIERLHFLNLLAAVTDIGRLPVMIDSSKFEVLEAGLKCVQGKAIVNSINLKEGEAIFLERARCIRRLGASAVVMLFDEDGQAVSYEKKIAIAERAYHLLVDRVCFPPQDIVFDLNILSIGTGISDHNHYAVNFLEACRWIKAHLPHCKVSGGISNLSFAFRGQERVRSALHAVFLYHAIAAGMDMGIVNAGKIEAYESLDPALREAAEDLVLDRREDATDRLLEMAQHLTQNVGHEQAQVQAWRELPAEERLLHSLRNGISDHIAEDMEALRLQLPSPIDVIEKPLMNAMTQIGLQFAEGKLFLPQIVKSARVMKQAVAYLEPFIEAQKTQRSEAIKILMATVKGDVHDIGKNIAGVILSCNGYQVIDLGVMVPCATILDQALSENVRLIGLSGLITPSLDEMAHVAKACEEAGLTIPIIVSGASTSELHTAVCLNPLYRGGVYHAKDASHGATIIRELLSDREPVFVKETQQRYRDLKSQYETKQATKNLLSLEEARLRKRPYEQLAPCKPKSMGPQDLLNYPLIKVVPYIDWRYFFYSWDLPGEKIGSLSKAASTLFQDAHLLLERMIKEHVLTAHAVYGCFRAYREDETIVVLDGSQKYRFGVGRILRPDVEYNESLADRLPDGLDGPEAYVCLFACSSGFGVDAFAQQLAATGDDYLAILAKSLADRLAEAFAEHLHERIRKEFWGYAADEQLSIEDILQDRYQGFRAAIGYPSCPDHELKRPLFEALLATPITGIELSESAMMIPAASTCGIIFDR